MRRLKVLKVRQYAKIFAPCVQRLFPTRVTAHSDLKFLLNYVATSEPLCNSLYQRLLDAGEKEESAKEIVSYVKTIGTSYDLDDPAVYRAVKHAFFPARWWVYF